MTSLIFLTGALCVLAAYWFVKRNWSFAAQSPQDYAAQSPQFDLRQHLSGPLLCEGVIYGPTGRVASRFVADMDARWEGTTGVMTEAFRYDNGSTQDRSWTLELNGDQIVATAPDVVGRGQGQQAGPGVCLRYRLRLPEASGGHVLDVTDWMYLMENGAIINRSQFRKYGIKVAELVATMRPDPARAANLQSAPEHAA